MADTHNPSQDRFDADTKNGVLTVLRDEGLYRHLRFRFENGSFRWFEIVTWPDRLVITGDCETYTFTRLEDMFDFFRCDNGRIKPGESRKWPEMMTVNYDDPHHTSKEPMAKIEEVKT